MMSVSPSLRSAPEQMSDDSLRTELEELRRTIRANEDARAAVQAAYTDQMGELAERRSNIEEHVHQELSKICGPVDEGTPEARASLEREIKDAKSQYSSLRTKRREVKKRLKSSEERAAASNERLQAVFGELEKLKVAMSVRQVQAAAAELRHAKRKLEIQAELKKEKDATRQCFDEYVAERIREAESQLARKYRPMIAKIGRESSERVKKLEREATLAAKKKARLLAAKASKRFEEVVWPALLKLEVSTRAQQHVSMALTSEFEARQAALGDRPTPPPTVRRELLGLPATRSPALAPTPASRDALDVGSTPAKGGALTLAELAAQPLSTSERAGPPLTNEGTPVTPGTPAAAGASMGFGSFQQLKARTLRLLSQASEKSEAELLRMVKFLMEAQLAVTTYSEVLDSMYIAERTRVLNSLKGGPMS